MRTETSVHKVAKIEIGERRFHDSETSPFWVRDIVITDVEGHSHTINVYANGQEDEDCLKVTT